jgi:hypothetical protein
LLLRRAASCDQADLRSSNQVSMAMINVNVLARIFHNSSDF